jgi:hypothetical protein
LLIRGTTDDRGAAWRVGDYAGLVVELDAALVRLAQDIRVCLAGFRNDSTPPARCGAGTPQSLPVIFFGAPSFNMRMASSIAVLSSRSNFFTSSIGEFLTQTSGGTPRFSRFTP